MTVLRLRILSPLVRVPDSEPWIIKCTVDPAARSVQGVVWQVSIFGMTISCRSKFLRVGKRGLGSWVSRIRLAYQILGILGRSRQQYAHDPKIETRETH